MSRTNIFDVLGPIMIGPSSSHTAGAVRLGNMARKILGSEPKKARISLHGSFAETGKGHGTNFALTAGLLGMKPDDERIPQALDLAIEQGLEVYFAVEDLGDVHPNTVKFVLEDTVEEKAIIEGSSVGGGQIKIVLINDFPVEIRGEYPTLIILHQDLPGIVAQVTTLLAPRINIAQMRVSREKKGARALTVIEADQKLEEGIIPILKQVPTIIQVIIIDPLI